MNRLELVLTPQHMRVEDARKPDGVRLMAIFDLWCSIQSSDIKSRTDRWDQFVGDA
ncbi:hypothetical protein D3C76_1101120 [compost metagenome]